MIGSRKSTKFAFWLFVVSIVFLNLTAKAQVPGAAQGPPASPLQSFPVQVKKTIVFLQTNCLQDIDSQVNSLSRDQLFKMPIQQQQLIAQQVLKVITGLQTIKQSNAILTAEESARLREEETNPNSPQIDLPGEIIWRMELLKKMSDLTNEEFALLTDDELNLFPNYQSRGTGFLVGLADPRINHEPNAKNLPLFRYLITNRHVIQPGIENGKQCRILKSFLIVSHKPDSTHSATYAESIRIDKMIKWTVPSDLSVDLAATPITFPEDTYDHYVIPSDNFATDDDLQKNAFVEGDPVMCAGLFIQTFDAVHTLEPIVRSGTLAMIPTGLIPTTLQKTPGHVFLADVHSFGGNSGSPIFVDTDKFKNALGYSYKLLGVISGEFTENSDFSISVTTTVAGSMAANSDVSVVVPASEVLKLLDDPGLRSARDEFITHQPPAVH